MTFTLPEQELLQAVNDTVLESFDEKSLKILRKAVELRQKILLEYLSITGKNTAIHKKQLIKSVKKSDRKMVQLNIEEFLLDEKENKTQQYYSSWKNALTPSVWEQWYCDQPTHYFKIRKLQSLWVTNQLTNHLTSEGIQLLAKEILNVFDEFYNLAKIELKCHQAEVSFSVRKKVKSYLTGLKNEILQEKRMLCDAMISRLEVAGHEGIIEYDDINDHLHTQLKSCGIIFGADIKSPRHQLTADRFIYFHSFVYAYGNDQQRKKVQRLPWLMADNKYTTSLIDGHAVIVPQSLKRFPLPVTTTSFFSIFFPEKRFRAKFLTEKFYLLANLRLLDFQGPMKQESLKKLIKGGSWFRLSALEKNLEQECLDAGKVNSSWINRIFFRSRTKFMEEWKIESNAAKESIFERKMKFVAFLADQLNTRLTFGISTNLFLKPDFRELLLTIISEVEKSDKIDVVMPKWLVMKKTFLQALSFSVPAWNLKMKNCLMHSKSTARMISGLLEESSDIPISENDSWESKASLDPDAVYRSLLHNGRFAIEMTSFSANLSHMKRLIVGNFHEYTNIFWHHFFVAFLNTKLFFPEKNSDENMLQILALIKEFSPKYLQKRAKFLEINTLTDVCMQETKCRTLLFSLNENLGKPQKRASF